MGENRKIIGKYLDGLEKEQILSYSSLELDSRDLSRHWRRCSITSDFYAKYFSFFYPEKKDTGRNDMNREEAEYTISFILNELFENVAKYSAEEETLVELEIWHLDKKMIINISNYLLKDNAVKFAKIAQELTTGNPEELYIQKLEENVETGNSGSGLGYLTLMNDYGAVFGYNFIKEKEDLYKVTVQTHIDMTVEGE